jgi:transposase
VDDAEETEERDALELSAPGGGAGDQLFAALNVMEGKLIGACMKRHPRFDMHFIPTSSSWLNLVERWFREITDKRIRRGVFKSVEQLVAAITEYSADHNDNPRSLTWTAKVEDVLEKIRRAKCVCVCDRTVRQRQTEAHGVHQFPAATDGRVVACLATSSLTQQLPQRQPASRPQVPAMSLCGVGVIDASTSLRIST